jgi:hypothetical protein
VIEALNQRLDAGLASTRDDVIAAILARHPPPPGDEFTDFCVREAVGLTFDRIARMLPPPPEAAE